MFLQLTKQDGKALFVNVMTVLLEETDLGLVAYFDGNKWLVKESLNDVKYAIAQAFAAQAHGNNGGRLVT
jgi:uncharacterized protein YlzI (FlbEa/FlbD family)